jgi:NADH dehydrogenase (ubiquinone) 1 alpha subcomplex subunit 13
MTEAMLRGQKGLASVKDLPVRQDGPPPGGFPPVRYARRIANSGPSGLAVVLFSSVVIGWGMYQVGQGNLHRRFVFCDQSLVPNSPAFACSKR